MFSKFKKRIACIKNNRGSGIVSVLVAMFFLTILGITVSFMAYTGMQIKVNERRGVTNFYTAAQLMDEITVGFHEVVTESLQAGYKDVLVSDDATFRFDTIFLDYVADWSESNIPGSLWDSNISDPLLYESPGSVLTPYYNYNPNMIGDFLVKAGAEPTEILLNNYNSAGDEVLDTATAYENYDIKITTPAAGSSSADANVTIKRFAGDADGIIEQISLNGISLTYTNPTTNVTTTISTDIVITVPTYNKNISTYNISSIPDYAMITKEEFVKTGNNDLNIDGSVYAGAVELGTTTSTTALSPVTTLQNGELITPGSITLFNGNHFTVSERVEVTPGVIGSGHDEGILWVDDILLNDGARLNLNGIAFVADDLELAGERAEAHIDGYYYGFGVHNTDPSQSSSVIANGFDTVLDISAGSNLTIAGQSFVTQRDETQPGIMMGESLSVRPNQLAYLIPPANLGITSNPILATSEPAVPDTVSAYGINDIDVQPFVIPLSSGQWLYYYFYSFDTVADANTYFTEYFNNNTQEIAEYLDLYTELSEIPTIASANGNLLGQDDDTGDYYLQSSLTDPVNNLVRQSYEQQYANLCRALVTTATLFDNPYDYLVDKTQITPLVPSGTRMEFRDAATNDIVAVIANGGTVDTNTYPDAVVILTIGAEVDVNSDFAGLIISEYNINVNAALEIDIQSDSQAVNNAFSSTVNVGGVDYIFGDFLSIGSTTNQIITNSFDSAELVGYNNWKKG